MNDPRLDKCLTVRRESRAVEFKEQFDPSDSRQSLELLKDIVAIANSGGGTIAIGIDNAGRVCGTDVKPVLDYDHAKYCDVIKKYTMQDFADFEIIEADKDGKTVAIFLVNPPDSPLVFEKPGTYAIDSRSYFKTLRKTIMKQAILKKPS
jgi:predicted HTH transcriptional regulator